MSKLLAMVLLLLSLGCTENDETAIPALSGTYAGTFQRGNQPALPVSITFEANRFSGGTTANAPRDAAFARICKGTFSQSGNTVSFQNECFFTAEFDWTLILNDDWKAGQQNDRLILTRNDDRYALTKQ
jgi:hypothetical protein